MSFTDFRFYPFVIALFLLIVLVQFLFRNKENISNYISKWILFLSSILVIAAADWRFCLCMGGVIFVTYISTIAISRTQGKKTGGYIATGAVLCLCIILGYFKYFNFFMTSLAGLFGQSWNELNIILPIGISFYIFSAIGYVSDVYWQITEVDKSLLNVALFLAFFPKLICGPIVKGRELLPQLREGRRVSRGSVEIGIQIFVFGLFKKLVIADHLAVFIDDVHSRPAVFGTLTIWLTVFSYSLQLYFDFSGYSDMAIGIAKAFGYDFKRNFNLPFVAGSIGEYWERWHISLSTWLKEFIFNPLSIKLKRKMASLPKEKRKRYKKLPTYIGLIVTFFVSGIWHGAGWTFIVFGLCHGICYVLQELILSWREKRQENNVCKRRNVLNILFTFFLVNIFDIFFRAESLSSAFYILKRMFVWEAGVEWAYTWSAFAYLLLIVATLLAYFRKAKLHLSKVEGYYPLQDLSTVKGLTVFFVVCGLTLLLGYFGETYFIYGKF